MGRHMNLYLICPVRRATDEDKHKLADYVAKLEGEGHEVFWPGRDNVWEGHDFTGKLIMLANYHAIKAADTVAVFWRRESTGSKADLGMAHALKKPLMVLELEGDVNKAGPNFETWIRDWPWGVRFWETRA